MLTPDTTWDSQAAAACARLVAAGFRDDAVARWFGVPLVTDVRHVPSTARRAQRRGLGGWIAVLVGGEALPAAELGILAPGELEALVGAGLLERSDGQLRARLALVPLRGLLLASDRLDGAGADAMMMPDLSALTLAACLPPLAAGDAVLDVGCGAGVLALLAARSGARVRATDVDERALAFARGNARLNRLDVEVAAADLLSGLIPSARFRLITFNAPLLKAALVQGDPGEAARYYASERGEPLALEFLGAVARHLDDGGEALVHAQLTPAVGDALAALAAELSVLVVRFADAPDGTPHAVMSLRRDGRPGPRRAHVPLSPVCPHLDRAVLDALAGPRALAATATPLPAAWLELRESRQLVPPGARAWRALRFGPYPIDDDDRALLERLRGATLADLALDKTDETRLQQLIDRGQVILR